MKKYILIVLFLLSACRPARADSGPLIEVSVSSSRVETGGQITMDLVVSNAQGKIAPPQLGTLDGFTAYSQGHSQQISIINGQMSSRSVFSYALVANSVGKKKIGPFQVMIDGKPFPASPVEVEVVPSSSPGPAASPGAVAPAPARAVPSGTAPDQDVYVQAWLDKDEVYVNEPVTMTYTFYKRVPASCGGFQKEPVTTGFWVEVLPSDNLGGPKEKILNNSRYIAEDVHKIVLFPTDAGTFTVDPGILTADVRLRDNDIDDPFSGGTFGFPFTPRTVTKSLAISPVKILVKALPPEGRPADFNGAVGDYGLEGSVDKNDVQTGDPVTYRIRVSGKGNISTLQMPAFPKMDNFKVYDSSSSVNLSKDRLIVEGEKIAETVIAPRKPGKFTIPPVSFSYFDPADGRYKTLKTAPQVITAAGAAQADDEKISSSAVPVEPPAKLPAREEVSAPVKDIRFIRTSRPFRALSGYDFYKNPFYWLLAGIFFAGWMALGALASDSKTGRLAALKDVQFKRSHAIARQKLKDARRLLHEDKADLFYAEMSRAVYGYFGGKLGVSPQSVSLQEIETRGGEELSAELFNDIKKLFDRLSAGRFAMSRASREDMQELFGLADRSITFFEKVKLK